MNEYDSSRIVDLLKEQGDAELVDSPENADLLVLNTCSICLLYTSDAADE